MIEYGRQRSTVKPLELELTETKVFVASNIIPVNEPDTEDQPGFTGKRMGIRRDGSMFSVFISFTFRMDNPEAAIRKPPMMVISVISGPVRKVWRKEAPR